MKNSANTYIEYKGTKFTIKNKNKRWHVGFRWNGRRHTKSAHCFATKENFIIVKNEFIPQLVQELLAITQDYNLSNHETNNEITLDDMAEQHFVLHKDDVRSHVYTRNLGNYYKHIHPYFKGKTLNSIKPMELEAWQNRLLTKYKVSTVQKYRSILFGIFTRAFQNDLVGNNPLEKVTSPKMKRKMSLSNSDDINPFTQKEIDTLVNADDNTYMPNLIKIIAYSGIRIGELIAVRWSNVDFSNRTIDINSTIVNGVIGFPKTQSSIRVIDMLDGAYEGLQEQFKRTGTQDYVFLNSSNTRFFSSDIINLNLRKRLIKHNIPVRPLYQLRHSFASRMIQSGVDLTWVSKTLGHLDTSITLKSYTKYLIEDNETRLNNLNNINIKISA